MSITMIGLDTAKSVFQVHAVNESGKVEIRRKLQRNVLDLVPREARGLHRRHGGVRRGASMGPDADRAGTRRQAGRARAVRPFVKKGKKNDAADAAALCAAA
jgi:transposase